MLLLTIHDSATYGELRLIYVIQFHIPALILVFNTIRLSADSLTSRLTITPLILTLGSFHEPNFLHASSEQAPFLIIAVYFYFINKLRYSGPRIWVSFLLGFISVCAFFTKLQVAPIILSLSAFYLLMLCLRKSEYKHYLFFIFSSCFFTALALSYIYIQGGMTDFIESYILGNLAYTNENSSNLAILYRFTKALIINIMPTIIWAITIVITCQWSKLRMQSQLERGYHLGLIVVIFSAIFSIVKPGRFFEHYGWLMLLPLYFLLSFYFVQIRFQQKMVFRVMVISVFGLFFWNIFRATPFLKLKLRPPLNTEILSFINAKKKPGDRLTVWGRGTFYNHETKLLMGTRDVGFNIQADFKGITGEYYQERFLSDLKSNRPKWFIDHEPGNLTPNKHRLQYFPKIEEYIRQNYCEAHRQKGIVLFMLR